jgi:hypothetical protein
MAAQTYTSGPSGPAPLPWLVLRVLRSVWSELPRALAAGLLAALTGVPLVAGALTGAPVWLVAAATLPPALAATALARHTAGASGGGVDVVLGVVMAGAGVVAGMGIRAGGGVAVLGAVVGAALGLVAPLALAYGAVRGRTGLGALRGGLILALYRPLWAVTLLALGVLGFFAVAASAGVLAVAVGPLFLAVAASVARQLLDEVDAAQGSA